MTKDPEDGEEVWVPTPAEERQERIYTMRLAGASPKQIARREGISEARVENIIKRALSSPSPPIEELRALENARLDMVQAPMLKAAREGSVKATQAYLRISERRSRLNGLDAPHQIAVSANVRIEMERQLAELDELLGEVVPSKEIASRAAEIVDAEVIGDERDRDALDRDDDAYLD